MKTKQFASAILLPVLIALVTMVSCSKERILEDQSGNPSLPNAEVMTCMHPKFLNVIHGSACVEGYTGGLFMMTNSTRNNLSWKVDSDCPGNYTFPDGPVTYGLYKFVGTVSPVPPLGGQPSLFEKYDRMHTFSTAILNMTYNGSLTAMPNGAKNTLFVGDPGLTCPTTIYRVPGTFDTWYVSANTYSAEFTGDSDQLDFLAGNLAGATCPHK